MLTRKISLSIDTRNIEENEKKDYISGIYNYLRESMEAQNEAFNLLASAIYTAKKQERSNEEINEIYDKYARQKPHPSESKVGTLNTALKLCPITDEIINGEIERYKKEQYKKKNPPTEQKIAEECAKIDKKYRKLIGMSKDEIEHLRKELQNYCAYPKDIYEKFANGLSTPAYVKQQVKEYFKSQPGIDMLFGKASLRNMKMDNPLILPPNIFYNEEKKLIGLTHEYDNHLLFLDSLQTKREVDLFFSMPSQKRGEKIKFKVILGNPAKSQALRRELQNIFEENYKIRGSKIGFTKNKKTGKNTNITLYLTFDTPKEEVELNEKNVVGVDLGQAIPAVCALNTNEYAREYIGSADEFLRIRKQMQEERKRLQRSLKTAKSGKGRKRKLRKLESLAKREANFVETYSHMVSKKVIDFALKYKAKYINLEYLKDANIDDKILRNWSYYKLQQYIIYKAAKYGIEVRFVNRCFTSQVCSNCNHWEEGQRPEQEKFICANDICRFHNLKKGYINADFNAARNISKSTLFIEPGSNKKNKDLMKEAAEYYGIPWKDYEEEAA